METDSLARRSLTGSRRENIYSAALYNFDAPHRHSSLLTPPSSLTSPLRLMLSTSAIYIKIILSIAP